MKTKLLLSLMLLLSATGARAMLCDDVAPFYLRAEGGASWSRKADICVNDTYWPTAEEGYNNDLGRGAVVGLGLGVNVNDWLSLGVSSNYRGIFDYCQTQTITPTEAEGNRTRNFDFDSTSYMFDVFFNRTGSQDAWGWDLMGCHTFSPYIGAGVGFAVNEVWNFHTTRQNDIAGVTPATKRVTDVMTLNKHLEFAWQVALGFDWTMWDCGSFAVGYRYFGAGDIPFNNYLVSAVPNTGNTDFARTTAAWNGKFRTNELVASFTMFF